MHIRARERKHDCRAEAHEMIYGLKQQDYFYDA